MLSYISMLRAYQSVKGLEILARLGKKNNRLLW